MAMVVRAVAIALAAAQVAASRFSTVFCHSRTFLRVAGQRDTGAFDQYVPPLGKIAGCTDVAIVDQCRRTPRMVW